MTGCPWLKAVLVRTANFTLHHIARVPTYDASNGFRMFSRRVIERITVESDRRLLLQHRTVGESHRLGWRIGEVPARWFERAHGKSRFRVLSLAAGLSALVCLCIRDHVPAASAADRRDETCASKGSMTAMAGDWPKIRARRTSKISPWMDVIEREVQFADGTEPQLYHAVGQADYVAILASTPDNRIPVVRQYRPAIEQFTWELPAGLIDKNEDAAETCRRELQEETGFPARKVHRIGIAAPCSGRLSNRIHSFFVETGERIAGFKPEAGIEVRLVTAPELIGMVKAGDFVSQLHIGTLFLAERHGLIDLGSG